MSKSPQWKQTGNIWDGMYRGHTGYITPGAFMMYSLSIDGDFLGGAPTLDAAKEWFVREVDRRVERARGV